MCSNAEFISVHKVADEKVETLLCYSNQQKNWQKLYLSSENVNKLHFFFVLTLNFGSTTSVYKVNGCVSELARGSILLAVWGVQGNVRTLYASGRNPQQVCRRGSTVQEQRCATRREDD